MIAKLLNFIKDKLPFLIVLFIIGGLVTGYYHDVRFLKAYVSWVLFLMVYPMMITLKITDVFESIKDIKPLLLSVLVNFILSPLLAFLLGKIFFTQDPMLLVGLILIGLIPTSGMTASWTGLAHGNLQLALVMISVNLLISILMIPVYMKLFLGQLVMINTLVILKDLLKVVVIPLILGDLTRRFILKQYGSETFKALKPHFSGISSLGVLIIVFIAMALKSKAIVGQIDLVLVSIIPLALFYLLIITVSHLVGSRYLSDGDRIALVYATTMRNLTIALGLSLSSFGESLAVLLIAIGYIVQLPIAAMYMKWMTQNPTTSS